MRIFSAKEIKKVIELHKAWLYSGGLSGERADLRDAALRDSFLRHAVLRQAIMTKANLRYANLRYADLRCADLRYADLRHADLRCADLRHADLGGADLRHAVLTGADIGSSIIPMACPSDGAFIGWKKARHCGEAVLVKLLIPEDAKRSSATGRKCRCDKAKVIEILTMKGNIEVEFAVSEYDGAFVYKKGETVCEPNFCEDRFNECAKGIHFFIDRKEAENY